MTFVLLNTSICPADVYKRQGIEQPDPMNPNIAARLKNIRRQTLTTDDYVEGILKGNINILSQAITLVESAKPEHQAVAQEVINRCLPSSGRSVRIGITGVPGAGKSTFIESFGKYLTGQGHKIAVLAIDPSSERSKGSILGDKTRMEELACDPHAYIRPSPSAGDVYKRQRRWFRTSSIWIVRHGGHRNNRFVEFHCNSAGYFPK